MELYRVESSKVFPFLDVFITLEVMVYIPVSISYEINWGMFIRNERYYKVKLVKFHFCDDCFDFVTTCLVIFSQMFVFIIIFVDSYLS